MRRKEEERGKLSDVEARGEDKANGGSEHREVKEVVCGVAGSTSGIVGNLGRRPGFQPVTLILTNY